MQLPQFLKEIDSVTHNLPHEDLEKLLHEMARKCPEDQREDFLQLLREYDGGNADGGEDGDPDIVPEIEKLIGILNRIDEGERCLESTINEEYDDWYNSDADEFIFTDPKGVLKDIDRAMQLIHECVDTELYKEGYALAGSLAVLEVWDDGEYSNCCSGTLDLRELDAYGLLQGDFDRCVRECLYLAYMGNELEERAAELCSMMDNLKCHSVRLEDVMQIGKDELPEFDLFLTRWIGFLGGKQGRQAEKMLEEALSFIQDDAVLLDNARKYVGEHPILYKQYLESRLASGENEKMYQIAMEALREIPVTNVVRSRIALLAAEYAWKGKEPERAQHCWLEAFRSNSTVTNYLRIRFRSKDWKAYQPDVSAVIEEVYGGQRKGGTYERNNTERMNGLSQNTYCTLLFWEGQFEKMRTEGMDQKNGLGWSMNFMKQGLAFMLLFLFSDDRLPDGLLVMQRFAMDACDCRAQEYYMGTGETDRLSDGALFAALLGRWKKEASLSQEEINVWLSRIDSWIRIRVEAIMKENRRKYYWECAAWIAAYGEVLQSLGEQGAKSRLMERYRSEYSRRSAFHRELRSFGMRK